MGGDAGPPEVGIVRAGAAGGDRRSVDRVPRRAGNDAELQRRCGIGRGAGGHCVAVKAGLQPRDGQCDGRASIAAERPLRDSG